MTWLWLLKSSFHQQYLRRNFQKITNLLLFFEPLFSSFATHTYICCHHPTPKPFTLNMSTENWDTSSAHENAKSVLRHAQSHPQIGGTEQNLLQNSRIAALESKRKFLLPVIHDSDYWGLSLRWNHHLPQKKNVFLKYILWWEEDYRRNRGKTTPFVS